MDSPDAARGKVLPLRAEPTAPDERVLWARFRAADAAALAPAWLALQCQGIAGVRAGLVLDAGAAGETFGPAASWPEGVRPGSHLLRAAERVLQQRRALALALEPQGESGPARTDLRQLPRTAAADTLAALQTAVLLGERMWIGYINAEGIASQRVVDPVKVEGGFVTAFDHLSDEVRTFALHRITGVAEVDEPA